MKNIFLREPVRKVRAMRMDNTHREQGLNPSTKLINAVLTQSDCASKFTSPNNGTLTTVGSMIAGEKGSAEDGSVRSFDTGVTVWVTCSATTREPTSIHSVARQSWIYATISAPISSLYPSQYRSPIKIVGTPYGRIPKAVAIFIKAFLIMGSIPYLVYVNFYLRVLMFQEISERVLHLDCLERQRGDSQ